MEIEIHVEEYDLRKPLGVDVSTRPTLLAEELEGVLAALANQGVSADRINALLERPEIKRLLPGQPRTERVQK